MDNFFSTHLLALALLCQEREGHCPRSALGCFIGLLLLLRGLASVLRRDRYGNIELGLPLKLARLHAFCHHAAELPFKVCDFFWVDFFLLSRNDEVFFLGIGFIRRVVRLGCIL